MATRHRTTFQKRQKELARQEKQRRKAERRAERKLLKAQRAGNPDQIDDGIARPEEFEEAASEDTPGF